MTTLTADLIDQMAAILKEGDPCDLGCKLTLSEEMKQVCNDINPEKGWCVVKSWEIWDIECSKHEADFYAKRDGVKPVLLYSECIIEDQKRRFKGGVRTSPLVKIHFNCIFETRNTFYILVETGTRKQITAKQAMAIFF